MKYTVLAITLSIFLLTSCKKYANRLENNLQILVADSANLVNLDPRSSSILHDLIDVVETKVEVKRDSIIQAHIFHPTIFRLDNNKPFLVDIKIESFSGDKNNSTVLKKKIEDIFKEDNVKEMLRNNRQYFSNFNSTQSTEGRVESFLNSKSRKDSLIFVDVNIDSAWATYGKREYIYLHDIEAVKTRIKSILNVNEKASFTIILGMPLHKKQRLADNQIVSIDENTTTKEKQTTGRRVEKKIIRNVASVKIQDKPKNDEFRPVRQNQKEWSGKDRLKSEVTNGTISGKEAKSNQEK